MLDLSLLCGYGLRRDDGTLDQSLTRSVARDALADPATYDVLLRSLPPMSIPAGIKRRALWDGARKVFGRDIDQPPQLVGDCVGFGARHAVEYCQVAAILAGKRATFENIFAPFHWGMGRLAPDCGNNACGRQDGSMGSWQAKALVKYGCLANDAVDAQGERLPAYSAAVARQWGNRPGPTAAWQALGVKHLVTAATPCRSKDDLVTALLAGNPVTVASNQGFTMLPQADGFHHPSGTWAHQMMFEMVDLGEDDGSIEPHVAINNNWGDVHGQVIDFRTKEAWPKGRLRVRLEVALRMVAANDSFIYTGVNTWFAPDPAAHTFDPF